MKRVVKIQDKSMQSDVIRLKKQFKKRSVLSLNSISCYVISTLYGPKYVDNCNISAIFGCPNIFGHVEYDYHLTK